MILVCPVLTCQDGFRGEEGVILYPLSSLLLFDLQLPTIWHNNPSGCRGWDMYSLECPHLFFCYGCIYFVVESVKCISIHNDGDAFSTVTWSGRQEGHLAFKITRRWYSDSGDLSGDLHLSEFWFALPPSPSSLAALEIPSGLSFWCRLTHVLK